MFKYLVVASVALTFCYAGKAAKEQQAEASHVADLAEQYDDGKGSNNGAELTGLAHSSAIQAKNAVATQVTAGNQAAFGVKSSFATAAIGAAQAAQAALLGKQAIVSNLKQQLTDAQQLLQAEIQQFQQTENAAQATHQSAQQAQAQVSTLTAAVTSAQTGAQHASQAAAEAANALAAQQGMVTNAKHRVDNLLAQLHAAATELGETEISAHNALESAQIAQSNAEAAGAAVAAANIKSGHEYHH